MKRWLGRLALAAAVAALFAAFLVVFAPVDAFAGKKPPKCTNCPQTITLPDGRVCTLSACGSDCVYTCPF